jgi:hypothetical protein
VATYCGVEFTRYTIEWTNGPLPVGTKLYAAQPVPAVDQTMLAMADCMDMVRRDLIDMGIIDKRVAPMFIPEAVARYVKSAILAVPQGYKLVPVEPTEAMIRAGCLNQATDKFANLREMLRDDFVAMVAASPVVR